MFYCELCVNRYSLSVNDYRQLVIIVCWWLLSAAFCFK